MVRIQLSTGYLDVKEGTSFPLSFQVGDIRDISKRQGNFSKTITLVGNNNNNNLLNHYYDVNIQAGTFNINQLTSCDVIQIADTRDWQVGRAKPFLSQDELSLSYAVARANEAAKKLGRSYRFRKYKAGGLWHVLKTLYRCRKVFHREQQYLRVVEMVRGLSVDCRSDWRYNCGYRWHRTSRRGYIWRCNLKH